MTPAETLTDLAMALRDLSLGVPKVELLLLALPPMLRNRPPLPLFLRLPPSSLGEMGPRDAGEEKLGICRAGLRSLTVIVASSDTGIWSMILTPSTVLFFVL
jgi:hypothetical protein